MVAVLGPGGIKIKGLGVPHVTIAPPKKQVGRARAQISIYGQELNYTTWRLAKMNSGLFEVVTGGKPRLAGRSRTQSGATCPISTSPASRTWAETRPKSCRRWSEQR